MKVQNKKTKQEYFITLKDWEKMKDIDGTNLQRLYVILDSSELEIKQEKIPILQPLPATQEITTIILPIEDTINEPGFDSTLYSLKEIANYLEDKDIEEFRDKLENDPRKGMKTILK